MKRIVTVALREYESTMFIAETLQAPWVSVARPTAQEALDSVQTGLKEILELSHPKVIVAMSRAAGVSLSRETREVYRTSVYKWDQTEGSKYNDALVEYSIDIVRRPLNDELERVAIPSLSTWSILEREASKLPTEDLEADSEAEDLEQEKDAIDVLIASVRADDRSLLRHRPIPQTYALVDIEVEFEPLNLKNVSKHTLWQHEFSPEDVSAQNDFRIQTPTLEAVAQPWFPTPKEPTPEGRFSPMFERADLISEVTALLQADKPTAVVLVGPPRVGKTATVRHLAYTQFEKTDGRRLWFADSPRITSADMMSGGWQQQAQSMMVELERSDGILYLGRLIEALDAGKYVGSDYNLAQFLKPMLSDRRIRVLAEATQEEWSSLEKRDVGFARTFTVVRVADPTVPIAKKIIAQVGKRLSEESSIDIAPAAHDRAWRLQRRFAVEGSHVGRTVDFLRRSVRRAKTGFVKAIDEEFLVAEFCNDTGLPPVLLSDALALDVERVRARLQKRVIGQDDAVARVANVVGLTKAGLASPDRPLGSFMFVGPTGVGKTELAKSLAEFLFGRQERMIRLDMSEYSHGDAYSRLIGDGATEGDLSGPVKRQPFSVILLDEIEKAHPSVFDLLLQVLGEARLTDTSGKTTRFQNAIVIMTSNLGVDSLRPSIGFGAEGDTGHYDDHFRREAEKFYRPEFLARVDQFVAFKPLEMPVVEQIAQRELAKMLRRDGVINQDVDITFADDVAKTVATRGFDTRYGARPIKRLIEQGIVWGLSKQLAQSRQMRNDGSGRNVKIGVTKDGFSFEVAAVSSVAPDAATRNALLRQVDAVSDLRRRLQNYMYTELFEELDWEVENFDLSSQSPQFWDDPMASDTATAAERARRVVNPAKEVATELAALEDLAAEAYHNRAFDLVGDLNDRLQELHGRVNEIFMSAMQASYEHPNDAAFFVFTRPANEKFRDTLLGWYRLWAEHRGWELKFLVPKADWEIETPRGEEHYDFQQTHWKEAKSDADLGAMFGVEFTGENARPLIRPEEGVHRYVASEGNAAVEILVLEEHDGWPYPEDLRNIRRGNFGARTYNFRTRETTMQFGARSEFGRITTAPATCKLDPKDPITSMEEFIVGEAWNLSVLDWE